jgi:hypothetical protein
LGEIFFSGAKVWSFIQQFKKRRPDNVLGKNFLETKKAVGGCITAA